MESDWGMAKLAECRAAIDKVDVQILELLNERTRIVEQIGKVKQQLTLPIYEPKREDQVYSNIVSNNHGPLPDDAVKRVFERIIDEMRTIQQQRMREGSK